MAIRRLSVTWNKLLGAVSYNVYYDGQLAGTSIDTAFVSNPIDVAGVNHIVEVAGVDNLGREGALSDSVPLTLEQPLLGKVTGVAAAFVNP